MKLIPKYVNGNNLWYSKLIDYDPTKYQYAYDTSKLVDGDMLDNTFNPWVSNIQGYDTMRRYLPTTGHGAFGINQPHFNYTKGVEELDYYKKFGSDLLDSNGNFTPMGTEWAKAVDALIPKTSDTRFFNLDGQLRTSWTTKYNDAHGRPPRTFNKLSDYVDYVRKDLILGARHNVFLNRGKRYFYKDLNGVEHWVDPNEVSKYTVTKDPVRSNWNDNHTIYWDDYELTGPSNENNLSNQTNRIPVGKYKGRTNILKDIRINPADLLGIGRYAGNLWNNNRVYNTALKAIRPNFLLPYETHRQVYGDEGTKLYYYRNAALGESQASRAYTSDSVRQMAQQMEAKRVGDDLRAKGDLADNEMVKRTSDESNAHEWANTLRRTEATNYNLTEANKANAERLNLLAQKYSADWTSTDNFLQQLEYRIRQRNAKDLARLDQIWTLLTLLELENDTDLITARLKLSKVLKQHDYDLNSQEVINALKEYNDLNRKKLIEILRRRPIYTAKSGTKITYKSKDDLLYKTARDAVDHFRKMSKISADALAKAKPKPIKLSSHPTRKMQQGGVAPFTVYRPVALGGETVTEAGQVTGNGNNSSKSGNSKDNTLDLVKKLFESVNGQGLPIDVNSLYNDFMKMFNYHKAFGTEMSTDDVASMYLLAMNKLNNLKYSQKEYDKAKERAVANDALEEYAVTSGGRYVVLNKEGELSTATLSDIEKKGLTPITNNDLLNLRAYSPNMAGPRGDEFMKFVNSGIGMRKIGDYIKSILPALKSSEIEKDAFVSNKVKAGIEALLQAPEGDYKLTITNKNNLELANYALKYILGMLPKPMKAVLDINAKEQGILAYELIADLVRTQIEYTLKIQYTDITGKEDKDSLDKIKQNPLMAMQQEIGGTPQRYNLVSRDSNTRLAADGTNYSALPKVNDDMSVDRMLSVSGVDGILAGNKRGITFGDLQISPENLKDIMYANSGTNLITTLPCKIVDGLKVVNLGVIEAYERAELKALKVNSNRNSKEFLKALGEELKNEHLDSLLDSNGYPNKNMFAQFLVVEAYATDKVKFDKNSKYIEKVNNPDSTLENRMNTALSLDAKKSNYGVDIKDHWFEWWGYDDIYRGTMFIPLTNNPNSSVLNSEGSVTLQQSRKLEELYLISNKAKNYNNNNSYE